MSNHKISQETFDETLVENQELFEMSNEEAIAETISQFEQQGISNISTYIITSHPESEKGIQERKIRQIFQNHLNVLDALVKVDGKVDIEKACQEIDTMSGDNSAGGGSVILNALDGVLEFCNGTYDETIHGETGSADAEGEINDAENGNIVTNPKAPNKYEKALPFLTLVHSTESLFTLMSLLSIVDIDAPSKDMVLTYTTTEEQCIILRKVAHVIASLLSPRRASERDIKSLLKDKFLVMERLICLISYFQTQLQVQCQGESSTDGDATTASHGETLSSLMHLATAACKSSERNKVAFVRALKIVHRGSSKNVEVNTSTSTIALLVQALHTIVERYKTTQSHQKGLEIKLMTDICKLVSVLCRFDDFRPDASGTGGGLGVDSSMGMNVSSSHDHVLEFNRSGIVPILHEVSCIALMRNEGGDAKVVEEEDGVALAGAALSATRVLAVNDDIVQAMVAVGTLKVVKSALEMGVKEVLDCNNEGQEETNHHQTQLKVQRQHLTSGAIGLVRNLCGNDEIKTTLCLGQKLDATTSTLPTILQGMRLYRSNATIQEHGCGTLAAMALRKPANALRIVQDDGPREIVNALRQFPNNVLVQRQGALAVRNIVSRLVANTSSMETTTTTTANADGSGDNALVINKVNGKGNGASDSAATETIDVKDIFLDLGTEIILRQITGRHQGSVDEAYAALRDLGCQISMVKYDAETNTTKRRTEMFGEVKSNFRPVYEESTSSSGMQERIARHAAKNGM